jgi:hypothetical protein
MCKRTQKHWKDYTHLVVHSFVCVFITYVYDGCLQDKLSCKNVG